MKNRSISAFIATLFVLALSICLARPTQTAESATQYAGGASPAFPGIAFLHQASPANIVGDATLIDNQLINGNPDAVFMVTQNWNPGGGNGVYNPTDVGVRYDGSRGRWRIFNEDATAMPDGAAFNVFVPAGNAAVGVHASSATNTTYYWTNINHVQANNNPDTLLFITHLYGAPGHTGEYYNHSLGVLYDNSQSRWAVFNQDAAAMNTGRDFNFMVAPSHPHIYIHTATAANTAGPASFLDHPALINNPYALVLVTPNFNPGGAGGTYYNHPVGIWYDVPARRWCVFSEDIANIPIGSSYNIMIYASTTYFPMLRK